MLGLDAGAALTVAGFVGRALHFADADADRDAEGGAVALRAIGFDSQRLAEVALPTDSTPVAPAIPTSAQLYSWPMKFNVFKRPNS